MVVAVLGTPHQPVSVLLAGLARGGRQRIAGPRRPTLRQHPEYAAEHLSRIKQDTSCRHDVSPTSIALVHRHRDRRDAEPEGHHQHPDGVAGGRGAAAGGGRIRVRCMFSLGIIGTGLLAVPVLAGSAAYAVSEAFGWKAGLSRGFHEARGFLR